MSTHAGWKKFERRCCRDFGVERIPVTGERHGADGATSMFLFQFKLRRALPTWIFQWLTGISNAAVKSKRIGVLVLKTPRMEDGDALVVLRYRDWVDLHGVAKYDESPQRVAEREHQRLRRSQRKGGMHATASVSNG